MNFHNPYNFIPAADREPGGPLGDALPAGHRRLHPDLWTGHLAVTLTTVSPLLVPDAGEEVGNSGHHRYGTRVEKDADGDSRVYLPPTSIKGMLRSAYEAVTNSRMGVFGSRNPLAYRADSQSALRTRPVLIGLSPDGQPLSAVACQWLNYKDKACIPAVSLPGYGQQPVRPCLYADGTAPTHGDRVCAWVELIRHVPVGAMPEYWYWQAVTVWRQTEPREPRPTSLSEQSSSKHQAQGILALVGGQVHRTNENIKRKHDERLFITGCLAADPGVKVVSQQKLDLGTAYERYRVLIDNYRDAHTTDRRDDIWNREGNKRPWKVVYGKTTEYAWSRHLYDISDPETVKQHKLTPAEVAEQGADVITPGHQISCYAFLTGNKVDELVPVMISRRLYGKAPWDLLPKGVAPAPALHHLSPADRVFGWVRQPYPGEHERSGDGKDQAARGALRIGPVHGPLEADALEFMNLPLEILGAPKPSQARFYVGQPGPDGVVAPLPSGTLKEGSFVEGQKLRGRKVYPHQPHDAVYWNPAGEAEYRRLNDPDKQNRTITSWVRPGQRFQFTIYVRNLSSHELGALLWLLDPHRFGKPDQLGYHRLGHGKPLGFGSVLLELNADGHDLRRGDDWANDFRTLGQASPSAAWADLADQFTTAMEATLAGPKILESVRATAAGFASGQPVHYPRLRLKRDATPNYEWFVANARLTRGGRDTTLGEFGERLPYLQPTDRRRT